MSESKANTSLLRYCKLGDRFVYPLEPSKVWEIVDIGKASVWAKGKDDKVVPWDKDARVEVMMDPEWRLMLIEEYTGVTRQPMFGEIDWDIPSASPPIDTSVTSHRESHDGDRHQDYMIDDCGPESVWEFSGLELTTVKLSSGKVVRTLQHPH